MGVSGVNSDNDPSVQQSGNISSQSTAKDFKAEAKSFIKNVVKYGSMAKYDFSIATNTNRVLPKSWRSASKVRVNLKNNKEIVTLQYKGAIVRIHPSKNGQSRVEQLFQDGKFKEVDFPNKDVVDGYPLEKVNKGNYSEIKQSKSLGKIDKDSSLVMTIVSKLTGGKSQEVLQGSPPDKSQLTGLSQRERLEKLQEKAKEHLSKPDQEISPKCMAFMEKVCNVDAETVKDVKSALVNKHYPDSMPLKNIVQAVCVENDIFGENP